MVPLWLGSEDCGTVCGIVYILGQGVEERGDRLGHGVVLRGCCLERLVRRDLYD